VLAQRVASGAILLPLLLAIVAIGQPLIGIALTAVAFLAGREVSSLLLRAGFRSAQLLGPVLGAAVVFAAWLLPTKAPGLAALAVILSALIGFAEQDPKEGFRVWLSTAFGALYVALLAFVVLIVEHAPVLPAGAPISAWLDGGRAWLLVLLLGVWAYDTGAYAVGRAIGRRKLIPHVSPGKTWEGLAGGTISAIVVTLATVWAAGGLGSGLAGLLEPILLGLVIAAAAQAGDLAESILKRAAGAVESGLLIPGHGGVLDRVDSFLFAAPAAYLYLVTVAGLRIPTG
jgi:phosphatidate cytidylyltransferase